MSQTESRKGKSAYFVPTISISLVLIVVGMLVFILLNARAISDHVKRNIGFAVIVKDNTNEVEIKRVQKILDTQPYVYTSKYVTKEQAAKSFKKEMGEDFERILGANPLLPSIEIKLNPAYANNDSLAMIEKGLARFDIIHEVYYQKSMIESINENIRRITIIFLIVGAVLVLISLIFLFSVMGQVVLGVTTVFSVLFAVFMNLIHVLIGFIQAYVFMLLSTIFIGLARVRKVKS